MRELLFFNDESIFYDKNGVLKEEPEGTLAGLAEQYVEGCRSFSEFKKREMEAADGYVMTQWRNNCEPVFLEDSARNYAHRTKENARWSDITLALAIDMESPGEITTRNAAGDRYIGFQLPENFSEVYLFTNPMVRMSDEIIGRIKAHPHFKKEGLRLNIAGNALPALARHGITTDMVTILLSYVYAGLVREGVKIGEIRSGGQTGVDEAGIIVAQQNRIKCSVLAPKGFRMHYEDGVEIEDKALFTDRFKEKVIDYDRWYKEREDDSLSWGLADFNSSGFYEMLEYDIDLKIMHLNARESLKCSEDSNQ